MVKLTTEPDVPDWDAGLTEVIPVPAEIVAVYLVGGVVLVGGGVLPPQLDIPTLRTARARIEDKLRWVFMGPP
jgi:hypothetical protein